MIDVGAVTLVQDTFLQSLTALFSHVTRYAINTLYIFAAFELVLFGFLWALGRGGWERLFFKVLKIGLLLFVIQNYTMILDVIIRSFVQIAGLSSSVTHLENFIFNPALLWQYGYDHGLFLLKLAATEGSVGLSLIFILLGIGILLVLGLLGIQIVVQLVGFYLVSLTALIFLPFSVFQPASGLFDQAARSVLKAGVRVMVLIMVIGVAVTVWTAANLMPVDALSTSMPAGYNINQPLGLFFTGLLFLYLSFALPKLAAEVVGAIRMRMTEAFEAPVITQTAAITPAATSENMTSIQMATTIEPVMTPGGNFTSSSGAVSTGTTITPVNVVSGAAPGLSAREARALKTDLEKAQQVHRSISDQTLKNIRKTMLDLLKENHSDSSA